MQYPERTTGPRVDAALKRSIEAVARIAQNTIVSRWADRIHPWAGQNDRGHVPADVVPALTGLARAHGYQVRYGECDGDDALGFTHGPRIGGDDDLEPYTIYLCPGMSPASTARTLCHELAHAILAHPGRNATEGRQLVARRKMRMAMTGSPESHTQEAAAELAAGAVCRLAGIGTGEFSPAFLAGGRQDGITRQAAEDALTVARLLWTAVGPAASQFELV